MRARTGSLAVLAAIAAAAAGLGAYVAIPGSSGHPHRDPRPPSSVSADPPHGGLLAASVGGDAPPSLTVSASAGPGGAVGPTLTVEVSDRTIGPAMRPGFLGLSLEYYTLASYLGHDPARIDPVFLGLVRGLNPGQAPILRIGGNSTDHTWWPIPHMRVPRGVSFDLSQSWLALARALASRSHGRLILGINLGAGSRRLAAVEAGHLVSGVGAQHIAALEIGNEPDDYPVIIWYRARGRPVYARASSYGVASYLRQFDSWRSVLPPVPVAGPALARTQWMPAALHALLDSKRHVSIVTFHRYPLRACETDPLAGDYPTIPRLLSDASAAGLAARVAPFAATAHAAGVTFRLDELNSVSCKGKFGVSNTFASAVWVLDALFNLKAAGVDGVNIHMLPGSAYQAFSVSDRRGRWSAQVAPLYYGMLTFARAFPPGARLLRLSAPSGAVKAWATRSTHGQMQVVLINKNPDSPVTVRLALPGVPAPLTSQSLTAPSVSATGGVSLGGETFGSSTSTGALPVNRHPAQVAAVQGYYSVTLPGGSALLLTR